MASPLQGGLNVDQHGQTSANDLVQRGRQHLLWLHQPINIIEDAGVQDIVESE